MRLLKMAKTVKSKEQISLMMRTRTRVSVAMERLFFFAVFSLLFIHTISCLWIFLAVENFSRTATFLHPEFVSRYPVSHITLQRRGGMGQEGVSQMLKVAEVGVG